MRLENKVVLITGAGAGNANVIDDHFRAAFGKQVGIRAPDSPPCTCYDGNAPREAELFHDVVLDEAQRVRPISRAYSAMRGNALS